MVDASSCASSATYWEGASAFVAWHFPKHSPSRFLRNEARGGLRWMLALCRATANHSIAWALHTSKAGTPPVPTMTFAHTSMRRVGRLGHLATSVSRVSRRDVLQASKSSDARRKASTCGCQHTTHNKRVQSHGRGESNSCREVSCRSSGCEPKSALRLCNTKSKILSPCHHLGLGWHGLPHLVLGQCSCI